MATLNQTIVLFLILITGYMGKKFKLITNNMNKDLSNLILYIALPCMIITSLSSYDFSKELLIVSGKLIAISWIVYAASIFLSYPLAKLLKLDGTTKDIFQFGIVFSNVAFMGFPVINSVFGSQGIFYAALYNLPFNFILWTFGVMVLSRPGTDEVNPILNEKGSINLKILLNPGIISVFIGFILFLTSIKLPGPIFEAMELLGNITTPLSMIFVGSILADIDVKKVFTNKVAFILSGIRLLGIPLILLLVLKQFDLDSMTIGIPVIITAMPIAANCTIMATKYGNDYHLGSQVVFISTMLSMITIPLLVTLL